MTALLISNALLWVAVVGARARWCVALVRQIGVLHERVAPAGALVMPGGPRVGDGGAALALDDDARRPRARASAASTQRGRHTLLFFVSPTCPVCKTLLPVRARLAPREPCRRPGSCSRATAIAASTSLSSRVNRLEALPYVLSTELGLAYQVGKLPYAVLIDERRGAARQGLVNSREHVESLFEAERLGVASIQE